jgi:hypothetical protein
MFPVLILGDPAFGIKRKSKLRLARVRHKFVYSMNADLDFPRRHQLADRAAIEQLFARLKAFLRKMKARTVEELWRAIACFLKGVSKEECKAYLANSGYT